MSKRKRGDNRPKIKQELGLDAHLPQEHRPAPARLKEWFDKLDLTLWAEAGVAGLLEHSTSVGTAREFFINRLLNSILPSSLHIGTGKIIDAEGNESKQIDVVVYDPRFPMLQTGGIGLYFAEGVIAVIEVKSTLTITELENALDNCYSVMRLLSFVRSKFDYRDAVQRMMRQSEGKIGESQASHIIAATTSPKSHVFAYDTKITFPTFVEKIGKWYRKKNEPVADDNVHLPCVISARKYFGVRLEWWMDVKIPERQLGELAEQFGPHAKPVMACWKSASQIGPLAIHLIRSATSRLSLCENETGLEFSIDSYMPLPEYLERSTPRYVVRTNTGKPWMLWLPGM